MKQDSIFFHDLIGKYKTNDFSKTQQNTIQRILHYNINTNKNSSDPTDPRKPTR